MTAPNSPAALAELELLGLGFRKGEDGKYRLRSRSSDGCLLWWVIDPEDLAAEPAATLAFASDCAARRERGG